MIERVEAVVLKSRNWSETSRIVHVFSDRQGLLRLAARGARRPKSRFGAALDLGHIVQIVFYRSRTSDLHTLSEASISWRPSHRDPGPERFRIISSALEIPLRAAAPETPILSLYRNLGTFLHGIDTSAGNRHLHLLLDFVLHSLNNLGYHPILDRCLSCRRRLGDRSAGFSFSGGLVCHGCGAKFRDLAPISAAQTRWLAGWPSRISWDLHPAEASRLASVLFTFLNHQLPDGCRLRCFRLLPGVGHHRND